MKKILICVVFISSLIIPISYSGAQHLINVHLNKNGADKIQVNQYDAAIVRVADEPEAYYILDSRADLCFFIVASINGISTTRIPCKPFLSKIEQLEDKYDECK
jgi:hypothetical protein